MKKILILMALIALTLPALGQNILTSTLTWNTVSSFDAQTGRKNVEDGQIVTHQHSSIDWNNADGSLKRSFTVNDVTGSWTDVSNEGEIIYEVDTTDGHKGNVYFRKSADGIIVRLVLNTAAEPEVFELTVSTVTQ